MSVRDKRGISSGQRYREPEYWPFRVGAQEQSVNQIPINDIHETFDYQDASYSEKIHETFDDTFAPVYSTIITEPFNCIQNLVVRASYPFGSVGVDVSVAQESQISPGTYTTIYAASAATVTPAGFTLWAGAQHRITAPATVYVAGITYNLSGSANQFITTNYSSESTINFTYL